MAAHSAGYCFVGNKIEGQPRKKDVNGAVAIQAVSLERLLAIFRR
jgi:hypothetical protein